jgi:hypothetical protein
MRRGAAAARPDAVETFMSDLFPMFGGEWFWWIVAAVLLIGELLMPGVFLLWLAVAAGPC